MALHSAKPGGESEPLPRPNPIVVGANPLVGSHVRPPRDRLGQEPVAADVAYQLVHDELLLDGNPRLNLATYVTTWMEGQAEQLMAECLSKNLIDKDEYPQTAELESRCVRILADLWHAPDAEGAIGCSTTGSSEACMLAGLAMKRRWNHAVGNGRRTPNLVMGANVQVCWEKFCNYWEVEPRVVPLQQKPFHLNPEEVVALCDEDTIGVVAILGSTLDGSFDPVQDIARGLDDLQNRTGIDVPIHVDGASGAMIAPFLDPEIVWDFRLDRVASINTSGHKYGLVYPGVGWAVWRDTNALPQDLVFSVNYLGGNMPTFSLNFSRPGAQVVAQYYMFLRLGNDGFQAVQQACRDVAIDLAEGIEKLGPFELLSRGDELPVFAFTIVPEVSAFNVFDVSRKLKERGWLVPAYTFPPNREDLAALRIVCRTGFTADLAEMLLNDLRGALPELEAQLKPASSPHRATAFHH